MRQFITCNLLIIFFMWILPLGAFIEPAKEGLACGGQRAICLCSHLLAKAQNGMKSKQLISGPSTVQKESPGTNNDYLTATAVNASNNQNFHTTLIPSGTKPHQIFDRTVEHVPRA